MWKHCLTLLTGAVLALAVQAQDGKPTLPDLRKFIGEKAECFQTLEAQKFMTQETQPYFRWTTVRQDQARFPGYRNSPKLRLNQFFPPEVQFQFHEQKLERIYLSIYNRGDNGTTSQDQFLNAIGELDALLSEWTCAKGEEQKSRLTSKATNHQKVWIAYDMAFILRWSTSGHGKTFLAEYIQLVIEPFDPKNDPRKDVGTSMDKSEVRKGNAILVNVKKEEDGSVFIDNIPMVDQGDKGYCAVAVCERVMRYFGNTEVTQHTLAQIAQTTDDGTNSASMLAALKRISVKFGLRFKERYSGDMDSVRDIERTVNRYNTAARKLKKNKISPVVRNHVVYVQDTLAAMDPEVLRAMKMNSKSDYKKFQNDLHEMVNKGIPLIWRVTLGVLPEKDIPQAQGGHMRLLIGYNDKSKTVFYSDTWGAGHEKKCMPLEDAWVITTGTLTLEPRK